MGGNHGLAWDGAWFAVSCDMNEAAAPTFPPLAGLNRPVQAVVSPRAGGLSVRLNLNPDGRCNMQCAYCEVDRAR